MVGEPAVKAKTPSQNWNPIKNAYTCRFKRYELIAFMNKVCWYRVNDANVTEIDIKQIECYLDGIELETFDVCTGLFIVPYNGIGNPLDIRYDVYWRGEREIWGIDYVGGEQVFRFNKCCHEGLQHDAFFYEGDWTEEQKATMKAQVKWRKWSVANSDCRPVIEGEIPTNPYK